MNESIEVLKKIYKPFRYTLQGRVMILNSTSGNFVVKEKKNDIKELYQYLQSRSFTNFPKLVDDTRNNVSVYEYISGVNMPLEQKSLDLIHVVSDLHNKTTFYKNITEYEFKSIYDRIKENIIYLEQYYNNLYEQIKKESYMSPSSYAFIRNSSKLFASLSFLTHELEEWFSLVKTQSKKRVCLIHNHLSLEHFLKSDQDYLISWENARIDSPVMDLVSFYQNDYFAIDFEVVLSKYLEKVKLTEDEKKLFFILISIPKKLEFTNEEFSSCKQVREFMDYLFITENLVRPYYTIEQEN